MDSTGSTLTSGEISPENSLGQSTSQPQVSNRNEKGKTNPRSNKWPLDKCVALMKKRIDMADVFNNVYHNRDSWLLLIQELGWTGYSVQDVSGKFCNLVNYYKNKKPATGEAADKASNSLKSELINLVTYYASLSDKHNPPNVIDTGGKTTNEAQHQNETVILDQDDLLEDIFGEPEPNQERFQTENSPAPWYEENWRQPKENYPDSQGTQRSEFSFSSSSSSGSTSVFSSISKKRSKNYSDSEYCKKRRKRLPTQKEISMDNQESIKEMTSQLKRLVDSTVNYHSFLMKTSNNDNTDFISENNENLSNENELPS